MQLLWQSLLLILSYGLAFAWENSPLSDYTIAALAVLIIIFLVSSISKQGIKFHYLEKNQSLSIFILNLIITLLIFSTGSFNSSFFFLLYFLAFGIAFVFEPLSVFVLILCISGVFLPQALQNDVFSNMLRLGSLILLSPLAYFFGREYKQREKEEDGFEKVKKTTKQVAEKIEQDALRVLTSQRDTLTKEDEAQLGNIVKEAEELKKL